VSASRIAGSWLALALAASCQSFPAIERDRCGNAIVEPDNGEDCDGFDRDGVACGPPNAGASACRFVCDPAAPVCPTSFGCGADGLCRAPSGTFLTPTLLSPRIGEALAAGDFDGDGRDEVVLQTEAITGLRTLDVIHYDPIEPTARRLEGLRFEARVGRVDDDPFDDLVATGLEAFSQKLALSVLAGGATGLTPRTFPVLELGPNALFLAADVKPSDAGRELLWIDEGILSVAQPGVPPRLVSLDVGGIEQVAIGDFDEGTPCDELALREDASLELHRLCRFEGGDVVYNRADDAAYVPPLIIAAPPGAGLLLFDVNGDDRDDLLLPGVNGTLAVAYSVGDGTFHGDPMVPMPGPGDGQTAPFGTSVGVLSFGSQVADLNDDDTPDFFDPVFGSIAVSGPDGYEAWLPLEGFLSSVAFDDFNADGVVDLAMALEDGGLLFYRGLGDGAFGPTNLGVDALVTDLVAADIDGDGINDLLALVAGGSEGATLVVAHGRAAGIPEPPRIIAALDSADQLVIADLPDLIPGALSSAVGDIVLARPGEDSTEVAILAGNAERFYESPLRIPGMGNTLGLTHKAAVPRSDDRLASLPLLTTGPVPVLVDVVFESSLSSPSFSPPLPQSQLLEGAVAHIDLDGDGLREVAALAPSEDGGCSILVTGRGTDDGYVMTDPQPMAESFCYDAFGSCGFTDQRGCLGLPDDADGLESDIVIADVDGDGDDDLVASLTIAAGARAGTRVVAFVNDGSGSLDADARLELLPDTGALTSLTALQLDGDAAIEVVACGPERCLSSGADVSLPEGALAITAADVDGDGVQDLIYSVDDETVTGTFVALQAPIVR